MSNTKTGIWARRKARRALVQGVYQWQVSGNGMNAIKAHLDESGALKKADMAFFEGVLATVMRDCDALDQAYLDLLDRDQGRLDQVEQALLRLAVVELRDYIEVPYKVVIDEYVELAKTFGAQDSYKYINGVLDKLSNRLRPVETHANG